MSATKALVAAERELEMIKRTAEAPVDVGLGCSTVSHDILSFCCYCRSITKVQGRDDAKYLELAGWRLLAIIDNLRQKVDAEI